LYTFGRRLTLKEPENAAGFNEMLYLGLNTSAGSRKRVQKPDCKSPCKKTNGTGYGGYYDGTESVSKQAASEALKRQEDADKAVTHLLSGIRVCLSMVHAFPKDILDAESQLFALLKVHHGFALKLV